MSSNAMGTPFEQRDPPPKAPEAPEGLNPLAKLGWEIRLNKYKPTARETEVLSKCFDDGKWYYLNGALIAGAAMWNATGPKVNFIPRILVTGVAVACGRDLGGRIAGYSCMKKILSLEGSPLRAELISILQEDYPDHSLLKTDLGRIESPVLKSASDPEDYAQEAHAPVSSKDWASEMKGSSIINEDWPDSFGRGSGNGVDGNRRIPRIWEIAEKKEASRKDDGPDILADPFDLVMQTGVGMEDLNGDGVKENDWIERRRSRMTAKERKEYDRRRYEQRQEQRSY